MKLRILIPVLLTPVILILLSDTASAFQGLPPFLPGAPNQAPIDGGLGLLAAAGGAYAYKKLRARRRE